MTYFTFLDLSVFYRLAFYRLVCMAFYRLVCKIVNLQDINLKVIGLISDVIIDNCEKFYEVTIPRSYFYRSELFERFLYLSEP